MAYIGKVEVDNTWQKVEDLIKAQVTGQSAFAFDENSIYQLQSEAGYGCRLCNTTSTPADGNDGEVILQDKVGIYKKEGGAYLFAKVHTLQPGQPCLLKISKVGD